MNRKENRPNTQMRPISFEMDPVEYAEGSCLVSFGKTKVLCTASLEEKLPKWLQGKDQGWVTAEYNMLPRSTHTRIKREKAFKGGRSQEISRLIARSLRASVDLNSLKEKSIVVDCDVIQADGGTRTAAITGGFVALARAIEFLKAKNELLDDPILFQVAGLSAGFVNQTLMVDLNYEEDSSCDADVNFVFTSQNKLIEVQGTAEGNPFSTEDLMTLIASSQKESDLIFQKQRVALGWEMQIA